MRLVDVPRGFTTLVILVLLAACSPAARGPNASEGAGSHAAAGAAESQVSLSTPKEIKAMIDAGHGGVVVVNFWATWCPPCVKEMPELAKFYREYNGKGVTFISLSADHQSTKDKAVVPFVKSYELPFPVHIMYVDNPDQFLAEVHLDWDGSLPATFIFGPDGAVAWKRVGDMVTVSDLSAAVAAAKQRP